MSAKYMSVGRKNELTRQRRGERETEGGEGRREESFDESHAAVERRWLLRSRNHVNHINLVGFVTSLFISYISFFVISRLSNLTISQSNSRSLR